MAYTSSDGRLPNETASKTGHTQVVTSPWVTGLLKSFGKPRSFSGPDAGNRLQWETAPAARPLSDLYAVDGSFSVASATHEGVQQELAFVKIALVHIGADEMAALDTSPPHPLAVGRFLRDNTRWHATAFPLRNVESPYGSNYDAVRHIVFDSLRQMPDVFETLKWVCYRQWRPAPEQSPAFACPHCCRVIEAGFAPGAERMPCPHCGLEVLLTDLLGFPLDMQEGCASTSIVTMYMLICETLMLLTPLRQLWQAGEYTLLSDTLFLKDGPLTLPAQYGKLVPNLRAFFEHANRQGVVVHLAGVEKSGRFADYLQREALWAPARKELQYAVPSHCYITEQIQQRPLTENQYGYRSNWGEKAFALPDAQTRLVLNIPAGTYVREEDAPLATDIRALPRILATLPGLISRRYEGALYPICLANEAASLSVYPSGKVLKDLFEAEVAAK